MRELREVFEMTTKQVEPDMDAWREQEKRQRGAARNRKVGAFAVAAAIGLVTVAVILGSRGGPTSRDEPAVDSADSRAEEVATGFIEAFGAFDAERAIPYLAADADVAALVTSLGDEGLQGAQDELPLFFSMLEAMDYRQAQLSCEEKGDVASGTAVRCTFEFHLFGSDDLYVAPFTGSYFDITVRDGKIVVASIHWETKRLSPNMWEAFARWVSRTYPQDAALMYEDETYGAAHLSRRSIRLWEQRVREFVAVFATNPGPPFVGRVTRVVDGVPFSFAVPSADWYQFGTVSLNKSIAGPQGAEGIIFWTTFPDGSTAEPCSGVLASSVGGTAGDLAAAVSMAPGTELVSGPAHVLVGNRPAQHVVLTVREDVGCDPGYFFTWPDLQGGPLWPETPVGATIRVWIVDVAGTLLFIEAETSEETKTMELAGPELEREIEQIVASIRFG